MCVYRTCMILACVHAAHRCSYCLHVVRISYRIIHVCLRLVNRFPDTRLSPASLTPRCGRTSIWLPDKMCSCMLQYEVYRGNASDHAARQSLCQHAITGCAVCSKSDRDDLSVRPTSSPGAEQTIHAENSPIATPKSISAKGWVSKSNIILSN